MVPLPTYTTRDEVSFIADLKRDHPQSYERYRALILAGMRRWDRTVDAAEVSRAIFELDAGRPIPGRFQKIQESVV